MKKNVFAILLVLANLQIKAQDYTKWNVSLNYTTAFYSSIVLAPGINYSLSNSIEVGFMPSYYHNKIDFQNGFTSERTSLGANLIGKYYIFRENVMDPYGSLILGYGHSTTINNNGTFNSNYFNVSVLLGNELQIGKKGWNFDFNIGFLFNRYIITNQYELTPIYTIGVKKRFLIKE